MESRIFTIEDCRTDMLEDLRTGHERGTTTYFKEFDNCWSWRPGEVNIWSGYANEGKSLFLKQLALAKFLAEGKKFVFASPEDYPPKSFFDDTIHTLAGKSTDIGRQDAIREEEYEASIKRLSGGFHFLHLKPPYNTIPHVLEATNKMKDVYGLIIDPIMKFARPADAPERDDLYASYTTTLITEFARDVNVSLHLVIHQVTPRKDGAGLYEKPSMYQIKAGGSWADGVDNVLFVQRPQYAKDKLDPTVHVGSLKIKKQKLVGIPQDVEISYDRRTNRYIYSNTLKPVFNFDKLK